jgi:phosphoribosylglycinamide formyltransferase-1
MSKKKLFIGALSSHGGTNLQTIIDSCKSGRLDAEIRVVICNNSKATAMERARREGIPSLHMSSKTHPAPGELDSAITSAMTEHDVDLIVLAGYMKKLGSQTLERYRGRILNVHPALLPKYGGHGMYGLRVHQAVLDSGDKTSGVSIHIVDEEYDHGPVVSQRQVPVLKDDTAESLAERVLELEHNLYSETLQDIATGKINLDNLPQMD